MEERNKNFMYTCVCNIEDKLDLLRMHNADLELIEIIERIDNIGNISILNYDSLNPEELESIEGIFHVCDNMLKQENRDSIEQNLKLLDSLASKIEDLLRQKKLLLDKSSKLLKSA